MSESEKIKELQAMIIVLAKRICKLEKQAGITSLCNDTPKQILEKLQKEASTV